MFTVVFQDTPTSGRSRPSAAELDRWLTEWGEATAVEDGCVGLRSMPVRFETPPDRPVRAQISIGPRTALSKLVAVLFDLSTWLGSDVCLETAVTRAVLWLRLADEQDRQRLAAALDRADEHGSREEVLQRLWAFLAVIHQGRDLRWDAAHRQVVEMLEVGDGVTREEARRFREDARTGEVIGKPVGPGGVHVLAWRWMNDNYPGLSEIELGSIWPR